MSTRSRCIKIDLGTQSFGSKKAAKEFIKLYLGNNIPKSKSLMITNKTIHRISDSDLDWVIPLMSRHERWDSIGENFDYVGKTCDPKDGIYSTFVIVMKDGSLDYLSYHSCIDGYNPVASMKKAMRNIIEDQIKAFRSNVFLNENIDSNTIICELCKSRLNNGSDVHIDHVTEFHKLINQFLIEKNLTIIPTKNGSKVWDTTFEDNELVKDWSNYHLKNALLRPLCAKCNLTRSRA